MNDKTTLRDIVKFAEERSYVTALDVSSKFGVTLDQAIILLSNTALENPGDLGVYSLSDDRFPQRLSALLETPDRPITDVLGKDNTVHSTTHYKAMLNTLQDMEARMQSMHETIEAMKDPKTPKTRRRGRGELLKVTHNDPEDLANARREASMEIARIKATGTRVEYQRVYAKHCNRINVLERRYGVGAFAANEECEEVEEQQLAAGV